MLEYIIIAVASYLLGSISVSIVLSRRRLGGDVRNFGSGNAGATNVARVYGMKAGLITLLGDMAKTGASGLIGWLLKGEAGLALACAFCLIGHCWPLYFSFRGGKGVSVSACIALLLDWRMFIICVSVFAAVVLLTKYVSLSSMIASLTFPPVYWLLNRSLGPGFVLCCLVPVIVIFLHRGNIARLVKGQEPKFKAKSK